MKKNIFLIIGLLVVFSCSKIPLMESKKEERERYSQIKKETVSNVFEINYSLENFNSPNLDETRCIVNYDIKNISKNTIRASLTITYQSQGDFAVEGYIVGGSLNSGKSTKGKYSFEKVPCDHLSKISFLY